MHAANFGYLVTFIFATRVYRVWTNSFAVILFFFFCNWNIPSHFKSARGLYFFITKKKVLFLKNEFNFVVFVLLTHLFLTTRKFKPGILNGRRLVGPVHSLPVTENLHQKCDVRSFPSRVKARTKILIACYISVLMNFEPHW